MLLYLRKALTSGEISWDRRGTLRVIEGEAATDLWHTRQRRPTQDSLYHKPAHPNLRHLYVGADEDWNLRFGEQTLGED